MSGMVEEGGKLGGKLIEALPAPFLMLCLINVLFIGAIFWFEARMSDQRMSAAMPLLQSCMDRLDRIADERSRVPSSLSREDHPLERSQ